MDVTRNREFCLNILKEYTKSDSLLKHAYAVESCVRAYAEKMNEDIEYWGNVALLHDFDYEKYPTAEEHPFKGAEILKEKGFDDEFINAILSHADYSGVPRDTSLKKVLFACDEITGLVHAYSLMKEGGLDNVEPKGVIKKMKDKAFARNVNRDDIKKGAEETGLELNEHVQNVINAMKKSEF